MITHRTSENEAVSRAAEIVPRELLASIVDYFKPRRVILFGSAARAQAGADSDLDILVVLDDDAPAEQLSWRAAYEARRNYHGAVDVIPCRESIFRERMGIIGSLPHAVAAEGVVLYERA